VITCIGCPQTVDDVERVDQILIVVLRHNVKILFAFIIIVL